ncbi:hypothetical protein CCP2SC5_260012 [Azospirillaceae bacterium]
MEASSVTSSGVAQSSALRSSASRSHGVDDRAQDKVEFSARADAAKVDAAAQKSDYNQERSANQDRAQDKADAAAQAAHAAHAQAIRESLKQKQAVSDAASRQVVAQQSAQAAQNADGAVRATPRPPVAVPAPQLKDEAEASVAAEDAPAVEENNLARRRASENRSSSDQEAPPPVVRRQEEQREARQRRFEDSTDNSTDRRQIEKSQAERTQDEAPVFQQPSSPVQVAPSGANPNEALNIDSPNAFVVRSVSDQAGELSGSGSGYDWQIEGGRSSVRDSFGSSSFGVQASGKSEPIVLKTEPFFVPGAVNTPVVSSFAGASLGYTASGAMGPAMPVRGSIVNIPA